MLFPFSFPHFLILPRHGEGDLEKIRYGLGWNHFVLCSLSSCKGLFVPKGKLVRGFLCGWKTGKIFQVTIHQQLFDIWSSNTITPLLKHLWWLLTAFGMKLNFLAHWTKPVIIWPPLKTPSSCPVLYPKHTLWCK